jgi:hypothetical protein
MVGFLNVARFRPTAGGTADFTVSAAITGYQTPTSAGAVDGTVYRYRAESSDQREWEVGYGAYTASTTTLARTTIVASSTGSKVNFSRAPHVGMGLVLAADVNALQPLDATLTSIAALTPTTNEAIYFTASDTAAVFSTTAAGRALVGVTGAADKLGYFTSASAAATTDLTAAARSILDDASVGAIATTLGLGTTDSPQFTAVNIGHATDTTITRAGAGDIAVEGNAVYRAGGTDVPIADGGTGASTAAAAATNLGLGTGDSPQFTAVNIGHATDTTVTRVSAGVIAVEGATLARFTDHLGNFAATTSAQLAGVISDETGSGALVFGTSPGFTTAANPASSDGAALGTALLQWSDLFMASGSVLNLNNGDITVTHSANAWTLAGGVFVVPDAGLQVGASVPFSDSAGTLTLQNVDALDATTEATIETAIDTLANLTSIQGRTVTLADAGLDVLAGWDDSASAYKNFALADFTDEAGPAAGDYIVLYGAEGDVRKVNWNLLPGSGSLGGSTGATDNAALRADGTGGATVQSSALLIADTTGDLSRSGGGGIDIQGTNTNDDAAAGYIGEYISSTVLGGSAVALSSGVDANITSISLTAGDWDVWGTCLTSPAGGTTTSVIIGWVSTTSATLPTFPNNGAVFFQATAVPAGNGGGGPTGVIRLSLSATTTVYLSMRVTFAVSTMGGYGFIGARRVR